MLNQIAVRLIEEISGQRWTSFAEGLTGVSAKTWKKGGPQSAAVVARAEATLHAKFFQNLHENSGYSYDEAVAIVRQVNWSDTGNWHAFVRWGIPYDCSFNFPETETLARRIDALARQLGERRQIGDLNGYRQLLLNSGFVEEGDEWLQRFNKASASALQEVKDTSWETLKPLMGAVLSVALIRLLACWDVEYQSRCFYDDETRRGLSPQPIFGMLLPALRPGVQPDAEGKYPSRDLFRLPLRRMLVFLYCLTTFSRTKSWPRSTELTRTRIAASGGKTLQGADTTEQPLAKIFRGTRGLTASEFLDVWGSMSGYADTEESPIPPWPLYFVAQLWTVLLVRRGKIRRDKKEQWVAVEVGVHDDRLYRYWWDIYLAEFKAKGVKFGNLPWPDYSTSV